MLLTVFRGTLPGPRPLPRRLLAGVARGPLRQRDGLPRAVEDVHGSGKRVIVFVCATCFVNSLNREGGWIFQLRYVRAKTTCGLTDFEFPSISAKIPVESSFSTRSSGIMRRLKWIPGR